jgi:carboxymethylenebutenolidase
MMKFRTEGRTSPGYLALPASGEGAGVLVLHAWWGLNDFFKELCEQVAREGFVALAPDLYNGRTASSIDEAEQLLASLDVEEAKGTVLSATEYLRAHPAVRGTGLGAIGFSLGAAWALQLSRLRPQEMAAVVVFYGSESVDFAAARAAYLGHYALEDEWEPLDQVRQMEAEMRAAGREVTLYTYPGTRHWFFETNRPEYDDAAATLAWQRTCGFLRARLASA